MKSNHTFSPSRDRAFTLIEMLVVIAIIAILAALIFPAGEAIKKGATLRRARAELGQVELAINSYKAKYGHYPPDNAGDTNTWVNQLYYELVGTVFNNGVYVTASGEGSIPVTDFPAFFGGTPPVVGGFVNASKGGGEDSPVAKNFLAGLKATQNALIVDPGKTGNLNIKGMVLGTAIDGPVMLKGARNVSINPWRYRVSGLGRQNPESFDLWVDILIGGKTYRISNWNEQPQANP